MKSENTISYGTETFFSLGSQTCDIRRYSITHTIRYRSIKNVPKEHLNAADSITYYETFRWIYNVWEAYIKDEQHAQKLGTMTEKTNGQLQ